MYEENFYRGLSKKEIKESVKEEGFDPILISDPPGRVYYPHQHKETKLLAFLEGSMEVTFGGETYQCGPGDRVVIPGNVEHSAKVGETGCRFFWSERLIE